MVQMACPAHIISFVRLKEPVDVCSFFQFYIKEGQKVATNGWVGLGPALCAIYHVDAGEFVDEPAR